MQNIKRGDFANLLYNTIQFIFDNSYFFYAESMELINSSSLSITFDEELAEDLTEEDIADFLLLEMELAGSNKVVELLPTKITISEDRTSIIVDHADLAGKEGTIFVDDIQAAFDYAKPVATTGSVTLEGFDTPFTFDFDGATETTIKLPATDGVANLNGLELEVVDQFTEGQEVTVILESTDVETLNLEKV